MTKTPARVFLVTAGLITAVLLSYTTAKRSVDFPVYYATARTMLAARGAAYIAHIYGPQSGMGWPQIYRYPPLFLLVFAPFALLPFKLAATVWTALKFVALYYVARTLLHRLPIKDPIGGRTCAASSAATWAGWAAVIPALPYLAIEFHYGNAQFFIFAMVAAALLWVEKRPALAAFSLAAGISMKVWPLFFLPYLVAWGRARVAALALAMAAALTFVPAAYFGWSGNAALLRQWAAQEFGVASAAGEPGIVGFPSQSLHSVMMRYLVSLDYSKLPDPHYPKLRLADFDPRIVEAAWAVLAAACYCGLLLLARRRPCEDTTLDAVAFCGLVVVEPFTQNGDLVVLLWPIMAGMTALYGGKQRGGWANAAILAAVSLIVLQPLIPTAAMQRMLHVAGVDFIASCLLGAGLIGRCLGSGASTGQGQTPNTLRDERRVKDVQQFHADDEQHKV